MQQSFGFNIYVEHPIVEVIIVFLQEFKNSDFFILSIAKNLTNGSLLMLEGERA
jgi:hypothetical protein